MQKNNLKKLQREHTAQELSARPELTLYAGRGEEERAERRGMDSRPSTSRRHASDRRGSNPDIRRAVERQRQASVRAERLSSRRSSPERPSGSRRHDSDPDSRKPDSSRDRERRQGTTEARPRARPIELPPSGQPGALDDPLRVGMSGARCKWYLRYLRQGLPATEAKAKAMEQAPQEPRVEKRKSSQLTPPVEGAKRAREGPTPPAKRPVASYAAATAGVQVAILPADYPATALTNEQQSELEQALVESVNEGEEQFAGQLSFLGIRFRHGFIIVTCGNDNAARWLREQAPKLSKWAGPTLKTAEGAEIPIGRTVTIFFPRSRGVEEKVILNLLRMQNKGLNTAHWQVIGARESADGKLLRMVIDEPSADAIKRNKATVFFRFGVIPVSGLGKKETEEEPLEDAESQEPLVPEKGESEADKLEGIDFASLAVDTDNTTVTTADEEDVLLSDGGASPTRRMET